MGGGFSSWPIFMEKYNLIIFFLNNYIKGKNNGPVFLKAPPLCCKASPPGYNFFSNINNPEKIFRAGVGKNF